MPAQLGTGPSVAGPPLLSARVAGGPSDPQSQLPSNGHQRREEPRNRDAAERGRPPLHPTLWPWLWALGSQRHRLGPGSLCNDDDDSNKKCQDNGRHLGGTMSEALSSEQKPIQSSLQLYGVDGHIIILILELMKLVQRG